MKAFPEHKWEPWKFRRKALHYRSSSLELRHQCDALASLLGVKTPDQWYSVEFDKITEKNVPSDILLSKINQSPITTLQIAYPEHQFIPWKFKTVPKLFWKQPNNLSALMNWISDQLEIKTMDQWYRVTQATFDKLGGKQVPPPSSMLALTTRLTQLSFGSPKNPCPIPILNRRFDTIGVS